MPADHRVKERKKRDKYIDIAREKKKKATEHEGDGDTICNRCTQNNPQRFGKKNYKTWESDDK